MKDVKVTRLKNSLKINRVDRTTTSPPILHIYGEDFDLATEIFLNEQLIRNWIPINNGEILVEIPKTLENKTIDKIAIISDVLKPNIPNLTFFELGTTVRSVDGISSLVQHFIKILMQSPGSNKFQKVGGGLAKISGKNMRSQQHDVKADIVSAVNVTKNYITRTQQNDPKLPLAQKLADVVILGVNVDPKNPTTILVNLLLKNKLGEEFTTNVSL
jgi:hypothetical protein